MTNGKFFWFELRWSLIILGGVIVLAVACSLWSWQLRETQLTQLVQQQLNYQADSTRLAHLQQGDGAIREQLALYQRLHEKGIIGHEQRSAWSDHIQDIVRTQQLFAIEHSYSPHPGLTTQDSSPPSHPLELQATRMQLHLPLLHEDDLLLFLQGVQGIDTVLTRVESCRIEPFVSDTPSEIATGLKPRLHAECSIDWYTMRPPS